MIIATVTSRDILEQFFGERHGVHSVKGVEILQRKLLVSCSCGEDLSITQQICEDNQLTMKEVEKRFLTLGKVPGGSKQ